MDSLTQGPKTEISDFKHQLSGLLATLQKLPCGEQQAALKLLQLTVNHQLNEAQHSKHKKPSSVSQEQCIQEENNHCLHQETRNAEVHCDLQTHSSGDGIFQALQQETLKKTFIVSKPQSLDQGSLQNVHTLQPIQEKLSSNVFHHIPNANSMEKVQKTLETIENNLPLHKTVDSQEVSNTLQQITDMRVFDESQEHTVNLQTAKSSKEATVNMKEACCLPQSILDFRIAPEPKQSSSFFKAVNEFQPQIKNERTLYDKQQNILSVGKTSNCLQHSTKPEQYDKAPQEASVDKIHESQHQPLPLLLHNETQELTSVNSNQLADVSQGVTEFIAILKSENQNRRLNALQGSNSSQDFHESSEVESDETRFRMLDIKQERIGSKINLSNRNVSFDNTSSSSFNVSNFSHIHDKNNLYTEDGAYIYIIENVSERTNQDNLDKSLGMPYDNDSFLQCSEESEDPLTDSHFEKNPVDLSNASSVYNSRKIRNTEKLEESHVTHTYSSKLRTLLCKGTLNESSNVTVKTSQKMESLDKFIRKKKDHGGVPSEIQRQKKARKINNASVITEKNEHSSLEGNCTHSSDNDVLEVDLKAEKVKCDSFGQVPLGAQESAVHSAVAEQHQVTAMSSSNVGQSLTVRVDSLETEHVGKSVDICTSKQMTLNQLMKSSKTAVLEETNQERKDKEVSLSANLLPVCCRSCKRELPDVSLLSVHLRRCEGHLACTFCEAKFVHKVTYSKHMEGHKRNVCSKCPQSFCSHKKLKAHMKSEHNFDLISKTYPCHMCSKTFLKRSSLYYHLKVHATGTEHVCQNCGMFCKGNESFKLHMAEHLKATNFHCHICTASFRRRQQYDDHLKHHKNNNCEICGHPFATKRALVRHCRIEHKRLPQNVTVGREYKCDKCDRVFNRPSILQHHLQLHGGVKPLECRLCNKRFSHKRGLRKHMNSIIHEHMLLTNNLQKDHAYDLKQNFAFICEYCGIKLPTRHMLSKHSRLAHKVGITRSCPHCDYKTKRNHTLKRHMELHLENRSFMCEVCGSSFQALATLKDHHNFVHSDERNYKCSQCNKSFKNKSSLARHSRTHSDDRPYQCHCGTSYKRLSHLKRHMSSAHNEILKSRAVKKFKQTEEIQINSEQSFDGQDPIQSTEFSDGEEFEFVSVSNSSLSPVMQTETSVKSSSDILLPAQESIILMGESSNSEPGHLITVGDSQIIQLIPSTFQFPQESSFQAVSLVSTSELHTLPLSAAASYDQVTQNSQVVVEPFSLSKNSHSMVMVPASREDHAHLGNSEAIGTLRTLETGAFTDSSHIGRVKREVKQEMTMHTLESQTDLTVTPSLDTFDYSSPPSSQTLLATLPSAHYITHTHSNAQINQDLLQQNLICSDFVLPVADGR
ncbi:uncharacterized protein [Procambarus clarkii]|uniref:uncharacterized protein n=1 Tax=Procambarus clarkii TaxID=6728 RepID=UPI003744766A